MADFTPRTRSESFLNGEDLEPITRREHFYAGRENELPEGHQEPETREEWFIQKYREAGDVTIESLSITENGTYTAPSGKAYSPVSVNVPLPSNAYLLKTIEHEQVATFTDGTDNFLKSLEISIEPIQEGSGDPSPENIRPISGHTEANVTRCGKNLIPYVELGVLSQTDGSEESNTDNKRTGFIRTLPNTQYTISGLDGSGISIRIFEYKKDKNYIRNYVSSNITNSVTIQTGAEVGYIRFQGNKNIFTSNVAQCEKGTTSSAYKPYNGTTYTIDLDGTVYGGKLDVVSGVLTLTDGFISSYNGETLPSTWISDRDVYAEGTTPTTGAEVCYKLATPQTIQLTPTIIKSLQGANNLFASTGEIELLQYWGEVN